MFLLGFFAFFAVISATLADDMPYLNCNTLTGNLTFQMIRFARGMEDGDMLTITGMVYDKANISFLNIYPGFNNVFMRGPVVFHIREQYVKNVAIYNSWLQQRWGPAELTPLLFKRNAPYSISIKKNQRNWQIYDNSKLVKTYAVRHPLNWEIGNVISYGDWSVDSVSMLCVRPAEPSIPSSAAATPSPTAAPTAAPTSTKKPTAPIAEDPGSLKGGDVITKDHTSSNSNTVKNSNSGVSNDAVDTSGGSNDGNLGNSGDFGNGNGSGNGNNSGSGRSGGPGGNGGGGKGGKGGLGGQGGAQGGNGGNGANGPWGQWGQNGTGWNGPYPPPPYPHPYPPGYYPPGGFNGQNGNGQPNIIIINQKSDDDKRKKKESFSIDDSEDDEECEA